MQPDGTVKVKLPLDWSKDGNYKVYRVNDDGTITDMEAYRQGSHMVFETDHFTLYVIVEEGHEHDYQPEVTPPTCEDDGYTDYTCSKCGTSYMDDVKGKLGHNYDDGVLQKIILPFMGRICPVNGSICTGTAQTGVTVDRLLVLCYFSRKGGIP